MPNGIEFIEQNKVDPEGKFLMKALGLILLGAAIILI